MKFKKRPVVVEAEQWFPGKQIEGVITDPLALVGKSWAHIGHQRELDGSRGLIETLEGPHFVSPGDWVITGVKGERYPCKPDIFEATYEPVLASPPPPTPWPGAMPNKANPVERPWAESTQMEPEFNGYGPCPDDAGQRGGGYDMLFEEQQEKLKVIEQGAPVDSVLATRCGPCPCKHTRPCTPRCTCVNPWSSSGCSRCCTYGSPEQQRAAAERLAAAIDNDTASRTNSKTGRQE